MRDEGRVIWFSVYGGIELTFSLKKSHSLQGEYNLSVLAKQYKTTLLL